MIAGAVLAAAAACAALAAHAAEPEAAPVEPLHLPERPRVIVFAPHPDDETIAAGGLIQQLTHARADVHVVFITNGDGYPDAVRKELRTPSPTGADYVAFGRRRQREALEATHRLGVHRSAVHFLGFPDGGLDQLWKAHWSRASPYISPYTDEDSPPYSDAFDPDLDYDGQDLTAAIMRLLRDVRPNVIIMPHPDDAHHDHAATAYFVTEAADRLRTHNVIPHDVEILAYLVHDPLWPPTKAETPMLPPPAADRFTDTRWFELPLTTEQQGVKEAALRAYTSQLDSMPDLLMRFLRPNELFGQVEPAVLARIASRH
jgi:LmbE family N-acetylglucosaminyl deacetylase